MPEGFDLVIFWIIFLIYAPACLISTVFTFSLNAYRKIEKMLSFEILSNPVFSPLDKEIGWLNHWLMSKNRLIGPVLIVLSLLDIKLSFDLLNNFNIFVI